MPWLMKAEPDSRVIKGKDVKFSVDDFKRLGTSPWDGVRGHEAKRIMKEKMKLGDKVLFYHSNTKVPGVYGLAEIAREGYPDHTAWDPDHPYFDPKTDQANPTWYMVDVKFVECFPHAPTLALIRQLASLPSLPSEVEYIGDEGLKAIKGMALVNRGRLSVQPVDEVAYEAVVLLGRKGGWDGLIPKKVGKTKVKDGVVDDGDQVVNVVEEEEKERIAKPAKRVKASGKRKKTEVDVDGRAEPGVMEDEEVKAEIKGKKRGKAAASGGRKRNVAGQEIGEGEEAGGTIAVERAEGERQETKAVVKKGTPRKPRAGKAADPPHIGERRSARTKR